MDVKFTVVERSGPEYASTFKNLLTSHKFAFMRVFTASYIHQLLEKSSGILIICQDATPHVRRGGRLAITNQLLGFAFLDECPHSKCDYLIEAIWSIGGYGRRLVGEAARHLNNSRCLVANVIPCAIPFYLKCGFRFGPPSSDFHDMVHTSDVAGKRFVSDDQALSDVGVSALVDRLFRLGLGAAPDGSGIDECNAWGYRMHVPILTLLRT